MPNVTVFLSSSDAIDEVYRQAVCELALGLARRKWGLVWGGAAVGTMKLLGDEAVKGGCPTLGVVPVSFERHGIVYKGADEVILTDGLRDRKAIMEVRGDAFVILPGGVGTLEEFAEIVTLKQLALLNKPVCLVNVDGYYNPLMAFLHNSVEKRFAKPSLLDLFELSPSAEAALEYIGNWKPQPIESKWL